MRLLEDEIGKIEDALVFTDELVELVEKLKCVKVEMENKYSNIEEDIEATGYGEVAEVYIEFFESYEEELIEHRDTILNIINEVRKELPDILDYKNRFCIGKIRHKEILMLLDDCLEDIKNMEWETIYILESHVEKFEAYVIKNNKDIINERKRKSRRNESGFTEREHGKQTKIENIQILKSRGLTQSEVSKILKLSKGLICRYWKSVYQNGKWTIYRKL